jgi:hypothetical protein
MIVRFVPFPMGKSPQEMFGYGIALFTNQRYVDTIMMLGLRLTASDDAALKLVLQVRRALGIWLDHGHNEGTDERVPRQCR